MDEEKVYETAEKEEKTAGDRTKETAEQIVEKIKALVKEGNVTHIRVRKDDTVYLNLPMTVGVIGTILGAAAAPWALIIMTIATVGLKCTVEVEKKDGSVTVIHGKEN